MVRQKPDAGVPPRAAGLDFSGPDGRPDPSDVLWSAAGEIRLVGPGLHTGESGAVVIRAGRPGAGWWLNGAPVPALAVVDTRLCTAVATPTGPVMTVEHLFAALAGCGVADAELTVTGPEVPILDGSAAPFCRALRAAGLVVGASLPRRPVAAPLLLVEGTTAGGGLPGGAALAGHRAGDGPGTAVLSREPSGGAALAGDGIAEFIDAVPHIRVEPSDRTRLTVRGAFPGLGEGAFTVELDSPAAFEAELAPARTFGYAADADRLRAAGRARGAGLHCCLVLDADGRPLNPDGRRFPDEPFRHKCLDLLGDLARVGFLPRARVVAVRAGHALHARLAAALAVPSS